MKITYIAILAALFCASCAGMRHTRETEGIERRNAALATLAREEEIRSNPSAESFANDLVTIKSTQVHAFSSWGDGEVGSQPSVSDRNTILTLIDNETDHPLLLIEVYSGGRARVETGVVRGPLAGGGLSFYLIKTGPSWRIVFKQGWVS
jgi:hypothetical protein